MSAGKRINQLLLLSGGLDSWIAWHYLDRPACAFININQRYLLKERNAIGALCERYETLEVLNIEGPDIGHSECQDGYIPYRNLYLVFAALPFSSRLAMGGVLGDSEDDNNPTFPNTVTQFLAHFGRNQKATLEGPLYSLTKGEAVSWYLRNVGDVESLMLTVSCYSPLPGPCGCCKSCFRRWVALEINDLTDNFAQSPWLAPVAEVQKERVRRGQFPEKRAAETILAFRKRGICIA